MVRLKQATRYILLPMAVFVAMCQFTHLDLALGQEDLVVQPAKRNLTLTGYTRSQTTVTLSAEVSGRVVKINYDVGRIIDQLPYLDIDPTFIDLEIDSTRKQIEQLQVTRQKQRSRINYLKKDFDRIDKLFQRGSTPESRLDTVRQELDQARFDSRAVGVEIAMTQTRLRELQERKSRHTIYAPQGWIVIAKLVEVGELVTVNTPIARVADYDHLVVPLSVTAEELAAIQQLGREFEVELDGQQARAAVDWINPEFDEKTRKLSIELALRSYPGPKRGGLVCRLSLQTATENLWVPKQAVISRYENPRVILKPSGTEVQVLVLGQTDNHLVIARDPRLPLGTRLHQQKRQTVIRRTEPDPGP